jgi:hypothetical protein
LHGTKRSPFEAKADATWLKSRERTSSKAIRLGEKWSVPRPALSP